MKSNILLTSAAALLVVSGANAAQYSPFVGATMGLAGILYTNEADDAAKASHVDLPDDFFAMGLTGGVRFGSHSSIYNGGFSVNIDQTTDSEVEDKFTHAEIAKLSMFHASATYDNYIRVSGDKARRIDLVLGAGMGIMNYHYDVKDAAYLNETVYSTTFAFKIGVDFELTKHLTLSADTRVFVPTRSHYDAESSYIVGGTVKYLF